MIPDHQNIGIDASFMQLYAVLTEIKLKIDVSVMVVLTYIILQFQTTDTHNHFRNRLIVIPDHLNMGIDASFMQLYAALTEIKLKIDVSVMAALICIILHFQTTDAHNHLRNRLIVISDHQNMGKHASYMQLPLVLADI